MDIVSIAAAAFGLSAAILVFGPVWWTRRERDKYWKYNYWGGVCAIVAACLVFVQMRISDAAAKAAATEFGKSQRDMVELRDKVKSQADDLVAKSKQITELQPKPLKVQIRGLLDAIDPKILPAMREGQGIFDEQFIHAAEFDALRVLLRNPEAARFVSFDIVAPVVVRTDGTGTTVRLILDPQLLADAPPADPPK